VSDVPKPIPDAANSPSTAAPATVEQRPSVSSNLEKPLVAIPRTAIAAGVTGTLETANAVRRLPPVDPSVPTLTGPYVSGPPGAIPIYPSTGIQ
jgi:hypothetical protein